MEKNITLNAKQSTISLTEIITLISQYYSQVLEREISNRQTLHLIHAQIAFLFAAFPVNCPLLLRVIFVVWFAAAVKICKRAL